MLMTDLVGRRNARRRARQNNSAPEVLDSPVAQIDIPAGATILNADKHGFGDAMVTAWISEGSKGTSHPLIHFATGAKADLLRLFGQVVTPVPAEDMETTFAPGGREAAGMRVTRLEHRAAYLAAGGEPRRPTLIELDDDIQKWADRITDDKTILMFPQAAHNIRVWPAAYWHELYRLLSDEGWSPLICLAGGDKSYRKLNVLTGLSWQHVLAVIQRSRLVVTNSSGPAHICGTMGHPTLVVCGPTDPQIAFGHLDTLRCVFEKSMDCVRCHYRAPKTRPACWVGCEALHRLSPATIVLEAIDMLGSNSLEHEPLCEVHNGMWRQVARDRLTYDDAYFDKYAGYSTTDIGRRLNRSRADIVRKYGITRIGDVGIGCGSFIEHFKQGGGDALGFDVMPKACDWLGIRGLFFDPRDLPAPTTPAMQAMTCWDSLEHMESPQEFLSHVRVGMYLFVSMPIFMDYQDVIESKHYRPGEHLTYWTRDGFIQFARKNGFALIEWSDEESQIGRESIETFVLRKIRNPQARTHQPIDTFSRTEPLTVRVPGGIGDAMWYLPALCKAKEDGVPQVHIVLQSAGDHRDGRAEEFIRRFTFVDSVRSEPFLIHANPVAKGGFINYLPSGYQSDGTYLLIANQPLERGVQLEDIFSCGVSWDFMSQYQSQDADTEVCSSLPDKYVVVHFGAICDNTAGGGMNAGPMWTPDDWAELVWRIRDSGYAVVLAGAEYDRTYADQIHGGVDVDLLGKTTVPQLLEVLKGCRWCIGFASGVPILSASIGVPTAILWRPEGVPILGQIGFSDNFATSWIPSGSSACIPLMYNIDSPSTVMAIGEHISR